MAKQLNVNLKFNADSSQAKRELESLQQQLQKIVMMSNTKVNTGLEEEMRGATRAAAELSAHLQKATNTKTGNLDFSKLNQSIKMSGKSLQEYGAQLRKLGPDGQQAFMQLTQAVVSAEVPIRRTNALVKEFATTLANTARWQLSSSVLHGFMGALQSAYGYAQDLNESLNNIRIVTGRSVDEMADFAKQANKAAKALSATTTQYTNASLIYYQQGLSDAEVSKRADVTIKLANVSRQSAEDVSEQMTAVWNNFYDGSKSLEHYADVMTALGAATASSTQEIAGGLEKFAAVADTIGLSYEYAASALATITSNTRQSEEVVGTALKTIFARIQGLNFGETLDDGTTLNKYSEALAKVGIQIVGTNGQLKDMDTILMEMGNKWQNLAKDQQVALAQTVAGTRQYTQLVALMDNWNSGDSDSFMSNLTTANSATGALQEQADIYAESWEAASDRVTAAMEAIYSKLINDEFFIDLLNGIEKLIGFVDNLIDSMGGLKGVLMAIGTLVTKIFSDQLAQGLTNVAYNMQMMTEKGRQKIQQEKAKFIKDAADQMAKSADTGEAGFDQKQASQIYEQQLLRQQELLENADKMSEIEKITVQKLMDQLKLRGELAIKAAEQTEAARKNVDESSYSLYAQGLSTGLRSEDVTNQIASVKNASTAVAEIDNILDQTEFQNVSESIAQITNKVEELKKSTENLDLIQDDDIQDLNRLLHQLESVDETQFQNIKNSISGKMRAIETDAQIATAETLHSSMESVKKYSQAVKEHINVQERQTKMNNEVAKSNKIVKEEIENAKGAQKTWADTLVTSANAVLSFSSALSMMGGIFDTINNPDLSGWEKFTSILTTVGMLIPTLVSLWKSLKEILESETIAKLKNAAATMAQVAAERKLKKEKGEPVDESIFKTYKNQRNLDNNPNIEKYDNGSYKAKAGTPEAKLSKGHYMNADTARSVAAQTAPKGGGLKGLVSKAGGVVKSIGPGLMIAAGVAVAAGAIAWGTAQFNKYSKAAEEAAKVAQDAADNYEKVAEAYNSFKANISDYKAAKDGLKDLIKGTIEYQEAVMKANEVAQELVNQGDLKLGVDYEIDSDGLYQIKEDSLQTAQKAKLEQQQKALLNKQIAEINAKEAQAKSDQVDFLRKDVKSTSGTWANIGNAAAATGAGAGSGALIGAGIGSIVPGIGTAIGAGVGAIIGGIAGLATGIIGTSTGGSASGKEQEAIEKLAKAQKEFGDKSNLSQEEYEKYLREDVKLDDELLIKSLAENREEAEKLAKEINDNSAATKALNKQIAATALSDNKAVQNSDYTEEIINTSSQWIERDTKEKMEKLEDEGFGTEGINFLSGKNSARAKEDLATYAAAAGLGDVELVDVKGNDKNRKFVYKDADGNEKTVDLETMKETIAADYAKGKQNERAEAITKVYDDLDKREAAAVNAVINEDYSKLSISQLSSGQFGNNTADALGLSKEDLTALMGPLGGSMFGEMLFDAKMQEAQQKAREEWNKTLSAHTSGVDAAMNAIAGSTNENLQNISYGTLKAYGNMLEGFGSGEEITKFSNALTDIMEANSDDAEAIMQAASGIDWSQGQVALDQFNGQLYDMGIDIENNEELWAKFQNAVNTMSFSVVHQNLETMRQTLATIGKLAKDVKFGDIISDEDYKQLTDIDGSLKKDFVMTADGYMYVGDENLKDKASDATLSQLAKSKANNAKANAAYDALQTGVFKDEDWNGLVSGTDGDQASINMAQQIAANSAITSALGVDSNYISELVSAMQSNDTVAKDAAREKLKSLYSDIQSLEANQKAGLYDDVRAEEVAASTMSLSELDEAVKNGIISEDVKKKFVKVLNEKIKEDKDVYREVNNELEEISHNLSLIDKQKNKAYGADKVLQIKQEIAALDQQITQQKELLRISEEQIKLSQTELAAEYGFTFDENGNISNYDSLYAKYTPDEWEAIKEEIEKYEATLDTAKKAELDLLDTHSQLSAAALEKITYAIEYKTEVDDKELKWLEYQLGKIEDDAYSTAEALQYMVGTISNGSLIEGGQLALVMNDLAMYTEGWNELQAQWNNGNGSLTEADYKAGLDKLFEGAMGSLETLNELDKTMKNYYSGTLAKASEEIEKFTSGIEHSSKVLDHYKSLLSIFGKENDYKLMGAILTGQASVAKDSFNASKKSYEMYANETEKWKAKMAEVPENSEEWKQYQANWEAASEKAREAEDKMLSDATTWAEKEKTVIENTLKDLDKSLEESLTGGISFDELNTKMERAQSLQEEYLTTTNQIYETTKMMRTAQQAIDKSSNSIAKNKLKQFVTETKNLQEQGKLSQFELNLQQAKYDLLVAEIALEEAQNAKSTVRLTRDSEGNFGYVYTADTTAVNEAQQNFEDAQNALYNKGLEGAADYASKYQQTMSEMTDTLSQIHTNYLNGMYDSEEEYNNAMAEAKAYYYEKLENYSNLYTTAVSVDSSIARDSWTTDFKDMYESTETWKTNVNGYLEECKTSLGLWDEKVATIKTNSGVNFDNIEGEVKDIVDESSNLAEQLIKPNGTIDALKEELTEVGKVSEAYAKYAKNVNETRTALENIVKSAKDAAFKITIEGGSNESDEGDNSSTDNPPGEEQSDPQVNKTGYTPGEANPSGRIEDALTNEELIKKYNISNPDEYKIIAGNIYSGFTKEAPDYYRAAALWEGWSKDKSFEENTDAWFKAHYIGPATLATGGYTGSWGPEGKLAMLHEKEIVLNKHDTENLLMSMDLLSGILSTIDSYAKNQQLGGLLNSPGYVNTQSSTLEQSVHIEASFPGVTDRNEIEEAFNNLVNKASQYANRK